MDVDKKLEEARDTITAHLKKVGKALQGDICKDTGLQKELVAHVLVKYSDRFDWGLTGGTFEKEFFLRQAKG